MTHPPVDPGHELVARVRASLQSAGDPDRAEAQQRYMKSALPFRGVTSPELKAMLRPIIDVHIPDSRRDWEWAIRDLWDGATHREEWYAALAIARHRRARAWLDPEALPLWRHLIVAGAWWDVVDETATHLVRDTLVGHPDAVAPILDGWAVADDLWLRRAAVICQVGRREATDLVLLERAIEANLDDPSFWLRKAIGWSLRDLAKTEPQWVWDAVDTWGDRLSGLSRREATKHRPPR